MKKRVKAGVLLYALLMSAIFALLLQFYLGRVLAVERQNQAQLAASKAYLIAQMTLEEATGKSGTLTLNQGSSSWKRKGDKLAISVVLSDGYSYHYDFIKAVDKNQDIEKELTNKTKLAEKTDKEPNSKTAKTEITEKETVPLDTKNISNPLTEKIKDN